MTEHHDIEIDTDEADADADAKTPGAAGRAAWRESLLVLLAGVLAVASAVIGIWMASRSYVSILEGSTGTTLTEASSQAIRGELLSSQRWVLLSLVPSIAIILGLGVALLRIRRTNTDTQRRANDAARMSEDTAYELAVQQERLQFTEHRFHSLFDLAPIGIAICDIATGRIQRGNSTLLRMTGLSVAELQEIKASEFADRAASTEAGGAADSVARNQRIGPVERNLACKDGSRLPVLVSTIRTIDTTGNPCAWVLVQDIAEQKEMQRQLTEKACHDELTGLANRSRFMERLQGAIERVRAGQQAAFSVLFLDFDRFKLVNDSLGHAAGDQLLREISTRLSKALRQGDTLDDDETGNLIARFGGDEFAILLNDLRDDRSAVTLAERLLNNLSPVYEIEGSELHSTASIGVVLGSKSSEDAEAVMRDADIAMYEAKRQGRGCCVVFNEPMQTRLARQVTIESSLRQALGTSQLWLAYQPIVDLDEGHMKGAEALLRWTHPVLGNLSPAEFIPVAEESGIIVPLGDWVLDEACRQTAEWQRDYPHRAPEYISVNVSRAQLLLGRKLVGRVAQVLSKHGIEARSLQLEVTENEVMKNPGEALRIMSDLQALGVRLAIDDFGTGASSLGCLRDYPFDTVKIDRSFVEQLTSGFDMLAVLHATVTLVENLHMTSVAEGVESAAQVATLQSLGCRYAQGYYFKRPVPPEELIGTPQGAQNTRTVSQGG